MQKHNIDIEILKKAFYKMQLAYYMAICYDENKAICKYVHSTSRGHEAIQLAIAFLLDKADWVSPYYRDESILLGLGYEPYEMMLQLLAKADDPFTGGRSYYNHANNNSNDKPKMIHQSSATGMQAIPTTGIAQGIKYLENYLPEKLTKTTYNEWPIVVCSLGDASITEGEVAEAWQFAALHQLPIIYLVQDNNWGISVTSEEARTTDAVGYACGFKGIDVLKIENGNDFVACYTALKEVITKLRKERKPIVVQANVALLGHHTSGVRKEFYRDKEELENLYQTKDTAPLLEQYLIESGLTPTEIEEIKNSAQKKVYNDFEKAKQAAEPKIETVEQHVYAPTPITTEKGNRVGKSKEKIIMVDAAVYAIKEIMAKHPEAVLYGQDVGKRLGGVFREAATLGDLYGEHRVFNTAIQEAYIIGSTIGLSAVGVKPIVEIQFADYIYPGLNQLVTEVSKSCYLTQGKFPVQTLIRVPIGAYGGGGPYHSGSIENLLLTCKGIKVVYPSNAADMKGLMKASFYDPNPVVMLEHKGLYWSKIAGTELAKTTEPDEDYIIPLGKANILLQANENKIKNENVVCIITYGMGVYWALQAAQNFDGLVTVVDLRSLEPLDETTIFNEVKKHGRAIVLTESQITNSFAEALAHRITNSCFSYLDCPVKAIGALDNPAVPINIELEKAMLPNAEKLTIAIEKLLSY